MNCSQATHTLMKEGGAVPGEVQESLLPTSVPGKRKRGRFILAASSNG